MKSKVLVFKGMIDLCADNDNYTRILLVQEDGYKIDLMSRFEELKTFNLVFNNEITVRYWVADKAGTKDELTEKFIKKILGCVSIDFEKEHVAYSEYTQWTNYNTLFNIGNHNLHNELEGYYGKFLYLEVKYV